MISRKALLYVAALIVIAVLTGCDVLKENVATSGPKRYKVVITQCLENARREIDENGAVSNVTYEQLTDILAKYKDELGGNGSYMAATEAKDEMDKARADKAVEFKAYQEAKLKIDRVLDALQTEIK